MSHPFDITMQDINTVASDVSSNNPVQRNNVGPQVFTGARDFTIAGDPKIYNADSITNIYNTPATHKDTLAEILNPIFGAGYDSLQREGNTGCTSGTRVNLLNEIDTWIASTDKPSIYWLSGLGGTGKSTIAHSVAHKYMSTGASFFFSREYKDRSEINSVIRTLAYQLGIKFPILKELLLKEVETNLSTLKSSIQVQLKKLLLEPINKSKHHLKHNKVVIVLDALDECDHAMQAHIIEVFAENINNCDFPIKFFITSRPEATIEYIFQTPMVESLTNPFILHNIEKEMVNQDIKLYLKHEFQKVPVSQPWPKPEEMSNLLEMCSQLFIAASTAVKFINSGRGLGVQRNLASIIENKYVKAYKYNRYRSLDDMYSTILELLSKSRHWNEEAFKSTISIIILGFSNMSYQSLLEISGSHDHENEIYEMLLDLKAVLLVPSIESNAPIHAFHLSFHDFLTNPDRCYDNRFYINPRTHHADIVKSCLNTLTSSLKINICNVNDFSKNTKDISKKVLTETIQYAATYWIFHFAEVDLEQKANLSELVISFIFKYLLQWIEVMSLLGQLSRALEGVRLCCDVLRNKLTENSTELFNDAEQFILQNFDTIGKYALQTYQSTLIFTPQETILYKTFKHLLQGKELIQGYNKYWNPCLQVLEGHSHCVTSVAISQDGGTVVSGSRDRRLRVWKLQTGQLVSDIQGHADTVLSVAISQDGSTIVSGSSDKTARVWNSHTGELINELWGHLDWVYSVAISQDGSKIVSASGDKTIRVWKTHTGQLIDVLHGHLDTVFSVAISQDGMTVVSGSRDKTVRVWNLSTGELIRELRGHSGSVKSVAISQEGSAVVSGSHDKTIRLWNLCTGELVYELQGHSGSIKSVAISQNGTTFVSGSHDKTVQIWNLQTGEPMNILEGHSDSVYSVAISNDGTTIVSGSYDKTIRVWDSHLKTRDKLNVFQGHADQVSTVAISEDGSNVVSGSYDKTVMVWDTQTNELINEYQGHSDRVHSIAISFNQTTVVSGSTDRTVQVWHLKTGRLIYKFEGHSHIVFAVAISKDGFTIVSSSNTFDQTVRIWNSYSGECIHVWNVHTNIFSLRFGNDNKYVIANNQRVLRLSTLSEIIPFGDLLQDQKSSYSIVDGWLVKSGRIISWLPPDFRPNSSECTLAVTTNRIAIGAMSGRVMTMSMDMSEGEHTM